MTGYISTVFDCPFEGRIKTDEVLRVCDRLFELGIDDLSLGDTLGTALPSQVEELLEEVLYRFPNKDIIMHFHDTRGMAIANIVTSMRYGIRRFDSSIGGLGGCPYAPGAAGNVATNDLLYLLHGLGVSTGIDEDKIQEAAFYIQDKLNKELPSRSLAYEAGQKKKRFQTVQANKSDDSSPQRKREFIYYFIKHQYEKLRSKAQ